MIPVSAPILPTGLRDRPQDVNPPDSNRLEPVWRLTGDLSQTRALVLATRGLDLICGLLRRGCLAATQLRPGAKPDAGAYSLLVISEVTALTDPEDAVRLARRSLIPGGRVILGASGARVATALARALRLNGFAAVCPIRAPGATLLRADLRIAS